MDILNDDQALHGTLVRDLGWDNPGLDLPSDFDDIVFKGDNTFTIPDDVVTLGVFPNSIFSTGSNRSFSLVQHTLSGQGQGLAQVHSYLDNSQNRHLNRYGDQQQQYHSDCQQQKHHHQLHSNSHAHQGYQWQLLQTQNSHPQKSSCLNISGQPQIPSESYDNSYPNRTTLPDSPPDSGSESHSPTDINVHLQAMADLESTIPGSLPTFSQSVYLGYTKPAENMPPDKAPPAYIIESMKLNHHYQGPPPTLLQQQQDNHQQPGQRPLKQYRPGVLMSHNQPTHEVLSLSSPINPSHIGSMPDISNQTTKKRKYSGSPTDTLNANLMHGINSRLNIKQESPGSQFNSYTTDRSCEFGDLPSYDADSSGSLVDETYQVIKWQPYLQSQWAFLTDGAFKDLPAPKFTVDADKGFNFSVSDEAFVCQKKNHFQVTVHMCLHGNAKYVRTLEGLKKIESFCLQFCGLKMESPDQVIKVEQSQSDRSKRLFHPVKVDLTADQETKVTVGRLHFSETTCNNMRKKGKPNPDQRYFILVVSLHAQSGNTQHMLVGSSSDRIIVRASNPGQFDSDGDVLWQKGQIQESVYHIGRVGINTDHPEEALTVHGNLRLTGHMTQPSDIRAKKNIQEINPKNQLSNVSRLRIYKYTYKDDYAAHVGIPPNNREDTGVLAQEILEVLPDAVEDTGDVVLSNGETIENFLVVNKDRIFMENVGAVKELCKLTDNLENRINQLEKMNKRLRTLKRFDSLKSTASNQSAKSVSTISNASSVAPKNLINDPPHLTAKKPHLVDHLSCSSLNGSQNNNLSGSKSAFNTLISWSFKKMCKNWIRYIFALSLLMAFCLVALASLYILELQKSDSDSTVVSLTEPAFEMSITAKTSLTTSVLLSSTVTSSTTVTTTRQATSLTTPTQPVNRPVLPPYPPCAEGYCEKLCCLVHHAEDPPSSSTDSNNSGQNGGDIEYPSYGEDSESVSKQTLSTRSPATETVIIHQTGSGQQVKEVNYNIINGNANNSPRYNVEIPVNSRGERSPEYIYRRRRDIALKPSISILELDYFITDAFCDPCIGNNYTYFIPYNASFGYSEITLKFSTQNLSYISLCRSSLLWRCPISEEDDTEIGGLHQQMTNGAWTLKIGNYFRTVLNIRVIYSLTGKPVNQNETCSVQNSQDYNVLSYTLQFQRQC